MNSFDPQKSQKQLVHLYPQERISFPQRRSNSFQENSFLPPSPLQVSHRSVSYENTPDSTLESIALAQVSSDLHEVIRSYQSRPDLLKLILRSKVEEDKRRTEEAKLRTKEIDLLLLQYKHMGLVSATNSPAAQNTQVVEYQNGIPLPSLPRSTTSTFNHVRGNITRSDDQHEPRLANQSYWVDDEFERSSTSTLTSSLRSYQMSSPPSRKHPLSPPLSSSNSIDERQSNAEHDSIDSHRTRRRREMQPITNIIETTEFPYQDGYCWKNNGTNRKTGNKSIYYKCSSSNNGCPVNKTVLDRGNGTFVIKYRGEHLPECASVRQIFDN
ncbi:hypothetical protein K450DRAFT_233134 [Umbelopsis ramanniana AG]|uniref:WRKY domain-containing protein n=1 Tax=Umbelopsis ramanniana AG TaxID=1314678 RepID=A0AAD5HEL2_UMBRA|nr:uncharacterized protein K450DRAFT_233134 [Umbelopsis ramanniana AG]KAI8581447.1 hypothetical protein K450DRAFT_233134 [Umbelopsis ramanniana AG]